MRQKSREVAAQKTKKKSEMDAKVSSEDSGLGAQSLPSISAGNLHSLSSDSILASVTSNQIPENAEIREYLPVMDTTDSGVYQSENGGQGNFPSQAPENSVNPKDSLYVHSGHSAQSHKITPNHCCIQLLGN